MSGRRRKRRLIDNIERVVFGYVPEEHQGAPEVVWLLEHALECSRELAAFEARLAAFDHAAHQQRRRERHGARTVAAINR